MNVAFIPVRGGSKSIPLKNIKLIAGKPLVYWTIKAACECRRIDIVYVATDNETIRETVESFKGECDNSFKIQLIGRTKETASDTASTESAMLEFAKKYEFKNIVLIQATSPLLSAEDLERGFDTFALDDTDSVLSVVRQKRFHWKNDENGNAFPTNYDLFHRPRRQEFPGYLVENGAFYITTKEGLLKSENRLSGNIKAVEMDEDSFLEIDEPEDWFLVEMLMKKKMDFLERGERKLPVIKMFLTDCDGCLTDGGMYYSENGDELKKFNTKDGMGFELLGKKGIVTGIITSENMNLNYRRAKKINIDVLKQGCTDKLKEVKDICKEFGIEMENVAYIGDDINDIEVIKAVGFSSCPCDACEKVKENVDYIAKCYGGNGVIREVAEIILKGNGSSWV